MRLSDLHDDDDWCDWCGGELPWDGHHGRRRFCSPACKQQADTARKRERRHAAREGRACAFCSGPIPTTRERSAIYCCRECNDAAHADEKYERAKQARRDAKPRRACAECGEPIPLDRRADARYCSERCKWTVTNRRARERRRW